MKFPRSRTNGLIAIILTAGLVLGIGLIVLGGEEPSATDEASVPTTPEPTKDTAPPSSVVPGVTLPLGDLSAAAITELTGLVFPVDMTDFLTSRLEGGTQLDITFVVPAASAGAFLSASGLPAPVADERLVTHTSPLWKLNPDEGSTLSGTQDDYGEVRRVVELIGDGGPDVRARIVITPA